MSGIVGIIHTDGSPVDSELLDRMTSCLAYRGPDAQRTWQREATGIGHALLRVAEQDVDGFPLSLSGHLWMTADARVDDRASLVAQLRAAGAEVSSQCCDALLILHAYQLWGDACVERLIGDFAFAIWDEQRQRLFCARDQFGMVPLYYAHKNGRFVFSNTLNCLHLHPVVSDRLYQEAIGDYLVAGFNYDLGTTFFQDIKSLPPAHTMVLEAGQFKLSRYWKLGPMAPLERQPQEHIEQFAAVFEQAVSDRLRANRVLSSLSGGMDSGSITAVAARQARTDASFHLSACSSGFDWIIPDTERYYASRIAEYSGTAIDFLSAEKFMISASAEEGMQLMPEPRFWARRVPVWEILEKAVASDTRVVLGGMGGDPMFEVPPNHWANLLQGRQMFQFGRDFQSYYRAFGRKPVLGIRRHMGLAGPQPTGLSEKMRRTLNPAFAARIDTGARVAEAVESSRKRSHLQVMSTHPFWLQSIASTDPDITGLPVRVLYPFFDVRLLRCMTTVPPIPWCLNKRLLREAMKDVLPEEILRRPKSPLKADFNKELLVRGYEPWLEELLDTPECEEFINVQDVRDALTDARNLTNTQRRHRITYPTSLAYWLRNLHRLTRQS